MSLAYANNTRSSVVLIYCLYAVNYLPHTVNKPLLIVFEHVRYYSFIVMVSCIKRGLLDSDGDNMNFSYITHSMTCVLLWDLGIDS